MKLSILITLSFLFMVFSCSEKSVSPKHEFALVIHGGAGTILKSKMTDEKEKAYTEKLAEVLNTGFEILNKGGNSLDAVQKCINVMEDSPLFNAGKGAVFTAEGKNELDASIMEGKNLNAGAVAGDAGRSHVHTHALTPPRFKAATRRHIVVATVTRGRV